MNPVRRFAEQNATGLLVFTALMVLTQLYLAIPLMDPVAAAFGRTGTAFALMTVFSICYATGFLIWGPLSDQWGRKVILIPGILTLAILTIACALAPDAGWLTLLRAAQGLVASSFAPVALAWLSEALPARRQATAIGAISTAFLVAGIFGQVLASVISIWLSWQWVFVLTGTVLLGCGSLLWLSLHEPANDRDAAGLGATFATLSRIAIQPRIMLLCAAHITLLLSFVAMYSALGSHLASIGLEPSRVVMLRFIGLPGMFAALAVGHLAPRLGMPGVARCGYLLAATGLVIEAALGQSLVGIIIGILAFVTGVALTVPAMIALFGDTAKPNRGSGLALNGVVLFVGASIGPLVAAWMPAFTPLLMILAALLTLAAILITCFVRTQHQMEVLA